MATITRIIATIKYSLKHKKKIKQIIKKSNDYSKISKLSKIDCDKLKKDGIKVLVLDFDGVLAPHGKIKLKGDIRKWIEIALKKFPNKTYLLSNNPKSTRFDWLKKNYPKLHLISGVRKKPYPDGLNQIIKHAKVKSQEVILVDDRLLTGVLASINAKTKIMYISNPETNHLSRYFLQELAFSILRFTEKIYFRL